MNFTTGVTNASYGYDALNRRVSKTVDGVSTYFIYAGDEVIEEYSSFGELKAEYVTGGSIDEVLTMERGGNRYYYHYDGLGSVTELTDSAGAVVENYQYDPYGNVTIYDGAGTSIPAQAGVKNPYMFTGRRLDFESGDYYYRARQYDPNTGRFLQRDPIGYADGMNLYTYVVNNPINLIDPFGERYRNVPRGNFPPMRPGQRRWSGPRRPGLGQSILDWLADIGRINKDLYDYLTERNSRGPELPDPNKNLIPEDFPGFSDPDKLDDWLDDQKEKERTGCYEQG